MKPECSKNNLPTFVYTHLINYMLISRLRFEFGFFMDAMRNHFCSCFRVVFCCLYFSKQMLGGDYAVEVRIRFKGLDLIDREPDELWTEVHDIVQEIGIKTIPMEKKCKKAKWLSEKVLQKVMGPDAMILLF